MNSRTLETNRLTAAAEVTRSEGVEAAHWLAVEISGAPYLIPLSHSGEIFPWIKPLTVPYTKSWFLGVVNLRGALCGVVDLSLFIGASPSHTQIVQPTVGEKCFVGFHASLDINTVLVVDQLLGLKNQSALSPAVSTTSAAVEFVDNFGRIWREIDMFELAKDTAFVNIAEIY